MNLDGTSRAPASFFSDFYTSPSYNAAMTKIVSTRGNDIVIANPNGTGEIKLTNTPSMYESQPRFSPDGTRVGFLRTNASGIHEFWEVPATGGIATLKLPGDFYSWDYSPNGQDICATVKAPTGATLIKANIQSGLSEVLPVPTTQPGSALWSPNGANIAFADFNKETYWVGIYNLGTRQVTYVDMPSGYLDDWGGLPRKRTFVGASGAVLNTSATGFLYGMSGKAFKSLLAFDSTDRTNSAIDVAPPTGTNNSNFIATITTTGQLNMLRYVNGYVQQKVTVIEPTNSLTYASGAIITYDASDGTVASVILFNNAAAKRSVKQEKVGRLVTLTGDFLSVYDRNGKKTATNVKSVTVDPKDGHVVSAS